MSKISATETSIRHDENVATLARNFAVSEFVPGDSIELLRLAREWALEFEQLTAGVPWGETGREWIEEIDNFFDAKYADWISSRPDCHANARLRVSDPRLAQAREGLQFAIHAFNQLHSQKLNGRFRSTYALVSALEKIQTATR